jgi:hypothetical protein
VGKTQRILLEGQRKKNLKRKATATAFEAGALLPASGRVVALRALSGYDSRDKTTKPM